VIFVQALGDKMHDVSVRPLQPELGKAPVVNSGAFPYSGCVQVGVSTP
jgi:hypothetical protein